MRRFCFITLALVFGLAFSARAQASALSLLSFDNNPDNLEDNDYETIVSANATVDTSDFFVGMFEIQQINGSNVTTSTFEGIFAARIASVTTPGGSFGGATASRLTFVPLTALEYAGLAATFTNLPTRMDTDSMIIVYDTTGSSPFTNPDGAGAGVTGMNDALSTATNGSLVAEFGLLGEAGETAIADINSTTVASITGLMFALALNSTYVAVPGLTFNNIPGSLVTTLDGVTLSGTELWVTGGRDPQLSTGDFPLGTDANFTVNAVPEPTSITLFALGALGLTGVGYRRRLNTRQAA
jgi:hypothetical protein